MKNILLVGDSIRLGYDQAVKKTLEGKANVYAPTENCRFAAYVLRYLHEYRELVPGEVDLIHWNAGHWDCLHILDEEAQTPLEIYAYYIERICQRIKKVFPKAKVVFATCTSVQTEKMRPGFTRYNEEIEAYNAAAVAIVKKYGFYVNDLYPVSKALPEEAHSDGVHYYTPIATEAFARQTLSVIAPLVDIHEPLEYKEVVYTGSPLGS